MFAVCGYCGRRLVTTRRSAAAHVAACARHPKRVDMQIIVNDGPRSILA
jgi:hypothetical protein